MKIQAMCWKELRENAKWGLIGLVLFSIALIYGWSSAQSPYQNGNGEAYQSICHPGILIITLFGFPVIGTALGFLQVIPEQARDRWAFLVHRPVGLYGLFLGKACAGLILYTLAAGLPYAFLCLRASMPGASAGPFYWGMALPGLVDFLLGACFYFLALLCAVREARWQGSKLVPLLAGLGCAALLGSRTESGPALLIAALMLALSAAAAAIGFCQSAGTAKRTPWQRAPLTLLLGGGFMLLLFFAVFLPASLIRPDYDQGYSDYSVLKDGEIVINRREKEKRTVSKLDGTVLPLSQRDLEKIYTRRLQDNRLSSKPKQGRVFLYEESYRQASHWFSPDASSEQGQWFFLFDENCFVRYSIVGRKINGYFGIKGFSEKLPPASERFPGLYHNRDRYSRHLVYLFDRDAYWIDLLNQQIFHLKHEENPEHLKAVASVYTNYNESVDSYLGAVLSGPGRQLSFFRSNGSPLFNVEIKEDSKRYPELQILKFEDNSRIYAYLQPSWDLADKTSSRLISYDASGKTLAEVELPPLQNPRYAESWQRFLMYPPMNLALWGWDTGSVWFKAKQGDEMSQWRWKHMIGNKARLIEAATAFTLLGIFSAALASRKMNRYHFSRKERLSWITLLFLTGLPGFLAFWTVHDWAGMVPCSSCKKPKRVDLPACSHCGVHWPVTPKDGTEIFPGSLNAG